MSDTKDESGSGRSKHRLFTMLALCGSSVARLGDNVAGLAVRSGDDIGGISARYADDFSRVPTTSADDILSPRLSASADPFREVDDLAAQWSTKHAEETGRLIIHPAIRTDPHPLPDAASAQPPWYARMTYEGVKALSRSASDDED